MQGSVARFDEESVHFETAQGPRRVEVKPEGVGVFRLRAC